MPRQNGSIIGPSNAPTSDLASGVWGISNQQEAIEAAEWPMEPGLVGQTAYTTPGTYSWVAPAGVYRVCVVAVGGGGGSAANGSGSSGGSGGGLGWRNNIRVTPGQSYDVVVGAGGTRVDIRQAPNGGDSYFKDYTTVVGFGGLGGICIIRTNLPGGKFVGDGGGNGGAGGEGGGNTGGGGGGAGGYSGPGGNGGNGGAAAGTNAGDGSGGGGGGGGAAGSGDAGGSGGGVGILGEGTSGLGGGNSTTDGGGGFGGSGGADATNATQSPSGNPYTVDPSTAGNYGGGGCGSDNNAAASVIREGPGGDGAVRIIWGTGRAFPSTNTGDI